MPAHPQPQPLDRLRVLARTPLALELLVELGDCDRLHGLAGRADPSTIRNALAALVAYGAIDPPPPDMSFTDIAVTMTGAGRHLLACLVDLDLAIDGGLTRRAANQHLEPDGPTLR